MGISKVPEVFQRKLLQALEGLPRIYVIADDVLLTGEGVTLEGANNDHNRKFRCLLTRCRERNIKRTLISLNYDDGKTLRWTPADSRGAAG